MRKRRFAALCLAGVCLCCSSCGGGEELLVFVEEKAPTCTEQGYSGHYSTEDGTVWYLDEAGKKRAVKEELFLPALGHSYGEALETKAPTCTQAGERLQICSRCGAEKREPIPALGHAYTEEETEDEAATCTQTGSASRRCIRCGDRTDIRKLDPLGHSYGKGVETRSPTCTEAGEETFTCSRCGAEKQAPVPAAGHAFTNWKESRANCLLEGELVRYCTRCSETERKPLPPRDGHTFGADNRCMFCPFEIKESEGLVYEKIVEGGKELGYSVHGGTSSGESVIIPQFHAGLPVIGIAEGAFQGRETLKEIVSYAKLRAVGAYAFAGCAYLRDFLFPAGLKEIGEKAFRSCKNLKEVRLPDETENIGEQAFYGCERIGTIELGASLATVGSQAFYGCSAVEAISVSPRNLYFEGTGNCLIQKSSALLILGTYRSVIPESVRGIGSYSFVSCTGLREIRIPAGVQKIGGHAFADCTQLEKLVFGGSEKAWETIEKGSNWDLRCHFTISFEK